jgi:hypothetical protein
MPFKHTAISAKGCAVTVAYLGRVRASSILSIIELTALYIMAVPDEANGKTVRVVFTFLSKSQQGKRCYGYVI